MVWVHRDETGAIDRVARSGPQMSGDNNLTPEEVDETDQDFVDFLDRLNNPPIRKVTARSFMRRLPDVTQLAITEAARTSAEVDLWLRKALAGSVELDHPETAAGIDSLIGVGLLTEADKVALLADGTSDEAP